MERKNSLKIAICDDEQAVLDQLRDFVQQYAAQNLLDYTILEFNTCEPLLEAVAQDPDICILFLDIYMSPLSGMELAKKLRAQGSTCAIIFVTVSTDHYAQSYEVNAAHYLVKPITYQQVETALSRCGRILSYAARCVSFTSDRRQILTPVRQIRFAEVFRNQTVVHANQDILLRSTLEAVTRQLADPRFFRTHRSFLVNMEYISGWQDNDIFLKTGEHIPLSRSFKKEFEREYGRFLTASMTGDGA